MHSEQETGEEKGMPVIVAKDKMMTTKVVLGKGANEYAGGGG